MSGTGQPPAPAGDGGAERPGTRLRPLTVSELNRGADAVLRDAWGMLWVVGEISRLVIHRSGHWYFSLKDAKATVSCAMFRGRNRRLRFKPEEGLEVLALATAGVYPPQGRYQLVIEDVEPRGRGAEALALAQLRKKLAAEGLFDEARKRSLPAAPRTIAVASSPDGAALRDVIRVLRRRFAGARVVISPCAVQGERAGSEIVRALARADRLEPDAILLVRGGGSREDLAAFDDEQVVRAVAACRAPVVTGIGHEIDTSLADLAADARAATPSAAAEMVVREKRELLDRLRSLRTALTRVTRHRLELYRGRLSALAGSAGMARLPRRIERRRLHLAELHRRLERAARGRLVRDRARLEQLYRRLSPEGLRAGWQRRRHRLATLRGQAATGLRARLGGHRRRLAALAGRLEALSPLAVLARGYSLVQRGDAAGAIVEDAGTLRPGELVHLRFARGAARAEVTEIILRSQEKP